MKNAKISKAAYHENDILGVQLKAEFWGTESSMAFLHIIYIT
jgi:hypothetical protein